MVDGMDVTVNENILKDNLSFIICYRAFSIYLYIFNVFYVLLCFYCIL